MLLGVYRGGVGYLQDLVVIFSTLVNILTAVMSYPFFSPKTLYRALPLSHATPKPIFFVFSDLKIGGRGP